MRMSAIYVLLSGFAQNARHRRWEPSRMFRPMKFYARTRRAAVKPPAIAVARQGAAPAIKRVRKGLLQTAKASWRRCTAGTNHISAFVVWRVGARRVMKRINRTGETRWHRLPSIVQQGFSEKGTL